MSELNEQAIRDADPEQLPSIAGELAQLTTLLQLRLASVRQLASPLTTAEGPAPPVLLDVNQAATLVNMKPIALRRSARFKSARRKLGERTLRFDRAALIRLAGRAS
jgi:hypothetical protein